MGAATGRLRDELAKYPFADGGFVLFCHYRYLAVEYLLVAVLSNLSITFPRRTICRRKFATRGPCLQRH